MVLFIVIEGGNSAGLWQAKILPRTTLQPDPKKLAELLEQQKNKNEPPVLHFVEVDPAQPVEEPKDPKFYSTANTQAANSDTRIDTSTPKIEGSQDKVPKTRDVTKIDPKPAQPQQQPKPTPKTAPVEMQPATKQANAAPPGDTEQNTLTPDEKAQRDMTFDRPTPPTRPRTLADARQQKGIIESPKSRQEGGVKKFAIDSDQDAKASPFGSYDAAFIAAVQSRWYQLLEQRNFAFNQSGKVVIDFRLYKDGTIRNLKVDSSEVPETLSMACQRSITDPSPYGPFPNDLRRLLGKDYRDIRFTFHYN